MSEKAEAIEFIAAIHREFLQFGGKTPLGIHYDYIERPVPTAFSFNRLRAGMIEKGFTSQGLDEYETILKNIERVKNDYSPLEFGMNIFILEDLKEWLRETFQFSRIPFPEHVVVGTSQFGHMNAMATAPDEHSAIRVILVDEGLFTFLNGLSKIISELFEKRNEEGDGYSFSCHPDDIDDRLSKSQDAHVKFVDLVLSYFITGHSLNAQSFLIDYQHNHFAATLRDGAELFILAHEYGHIYYKHLDEDPDNQEIISDNLQLNTWLANWSKEYQADFFASMLVMRYNHHIKDLTAEASFAPIYFLFRTLEMLSIIKGYKFSAAHPAPGQRLSKLTDSLYEDTQDTDLVNDIERFGKSIGYVIDRLYFMNREEINSKIAEARQAAI